MLKGKSYQFPCLLSKCYSVYLLLEVLKLMLYVINIQHQFTGQTFAWNSNNLLKKFRNAKMIFYLISNFPLSISNECKYIFIFKMSFCCSNKNFATGIKECVSDKTVMNLHSYADLEIILFYINSTCWIILVCQVLETCT